MKRREQNRDNVGLWAMLGETGRVTMIPGVVITGVVIPGAPVLFLPVS